MNGRKKTTVWVWLRRDLVLTLHSQPNFRSEKLCEFEWDSWQPAVTPQFTLSTLCMASLLSPRCHTVHLYQSQYAIKKCVTWTDWGSDCLSGRLRTLLTGMIKSEAWGSLKTDPLKANGGSWVVVRSHAALCLTVNCACSLLDCVADGSGEEWCDRAAINTNKHWTEQ